MGGDQVSGHAAADERGRVRFAELPAGEGILQVRDASGRKTIHQSKVKLPSGETATRTIDAPPAKP